MHILGISGSPRGPRSNTRGLVERVLEGARVSGAEVEFFDLSTMNLAYCTACGACHVKGTCPIKDDIEPLLEKMLTADGLVLGSPLYFNGVTAQLKTVLDRLSHAIHCQLFLGAYACSVATSGSAEYDMALTYMNDLLVRLGCAVVGGVGAAASDPGALKAAGEDAFNLGRDLVQAIKERRTYPEQNAVHAAMRERFERLVSFNKDTWPCEYQVLDVPQAAVNAGQPH